MHHYDGKNYELKGEIDGKTKALDRYNEGVFEMLKCAGSNDEDIKERRFDSWNFYDALNNPDVLAQFKQRIQKLQGITVSLPVVRKEQEGDQPVLQNDNHVAVEQEEAALIPGELSPGSWRDE